MVHFESIYWICGTRFHYSYLRRHPRAPRLSNDSSAQDEGVSVGILPSHSWPPPEQSPLLTDSQNEISITTNCADLQSSPSLQWKKMNRINMKLLELHWDEQNNSKLNKIVQKVAWVFLPSDIFILKDWHLHLCQSFVPFWFFIQKITYTKISINEKKKGLPKPT